MYQIENHWTNRDEIWYEYYTTGGQHNVTLLGVLHAALYLFICGLFNDTFSATKNIYRVECNYDE
jgi:hypothetical protein